MLYQVAQTTKITLVLMQSVAKLISGMVIATATVIVIPAAVNVMVVIENSVNKHVVGNHLKLHSFMVIHIITSVECG